MPQARQLLRKLLTGPLVFTPIVEGQRHGYRFQGEASIGKLLSGSVDTTLSGVPNGYSALFYKGTAALAQKGSLMGTL